jgi:hypothetical protein
LAGRVGLVEKAIRSRPGALRAACEYAVVPARTSSSSAPSATLRANGPKHVSPSQWSVSGSSGDAAALGLRAEHPARRGGDADRAAAVRAQRAGDEAGGDRRRAAAARSARAAVAIPRVARGAEGLRLGELGPQRELGHVRLADDDRAGGAQTAHGLAVRGRRLGHEAGPVGRQLAGDVHVVLDRDRHAEQRRPVAGAQALLRHPRLLQRALGAHDPEGLQLAVQAIDAVEVQLGELGRGDLAWAQQLGLALSPCVGQLVGVGQHARSQPMRR